MNTIKNFFKYEDSYKVTIRLAIIILVISILAYHRIIINYYTSPDGIIEGISWFNNADWSLQGAGRWLVRYAMLPFGNLVVPLFVVIVNSICVWISSLMIQRLWNINNKYYIYLIGITLAVTPTTIFLMTYTYTGVCIGLAVLFGISFAYFGLYVKGKIGIILSILSITFLLGLDQGFIGIAALITLLTLIIRVIQGNNIKEILIDTLKCIVCAIVGGVLYFLVLNLSLKIRNLEMVDTNRLGGFSFIKTLESFGPKFIETYETFINFFSDSVFKRNYIYLLIFIVILVCVGISVYKLIKNKKYINAVLTILLCVLIPPVSYIIEIIVPYYTVYVAMEYHTCLMIVLALYLVYLMNIKPISIINTALVILLSWTYILSANATYKAYELSYKHINNEMLLVLNDIYHTDGYVKNQTPILLAGFPNDYDVRNNDNTYYYAIDFPKNPVFWEDMNGATYVRKNYFMYYFGIDAKTIKEEDYLKIVTSNEFKEMPTWPNKGSIKMIDGHCVVKFSNNPPLPY